MRIVQTQERFPLSSVKPLDGLVKYRQQCLTATRDALAGGATIRRTRSLVSGRALESAGAVEGLAYGRCPETGSVFLVELPPPEGWKRLLADVSALRRSRETFHFELAQSRTDNVYAPKLEWIRETLRLQGLRQARALEVLTAPGSFTELLKDSGMFTEVLTADEMELAHGLAAPGQQDTVQAVVLLESLDRVDDPTALLQGVAGRLEEGGLLFVTALVSSGFDMSVLGLRNLYLYPPDRANCFSLQGLSKLLSQEGFTLLEVSTPGVLDVEIVRAHLQRDPTLPLSAFERQLVEANDDMQAAFQAFLQQWGLSSFTRIVARRGTVMA
ncbi:MAG: methyltransferase domain-containing protein [Candidatus Omnitrophica bacterium]|nr:methyltransferase domain-containing protein [Candidatus Omnitrophota bacterium]